jgi:hypothetical protein
VVCFWASTNNESITNSHIANIFAIYKTYAKMDRFAIYEASNHGDTIGNLPSITLVVMAETILMDLDVQSIEILGTVWAEIKGTIYRKQ